MVVVVVVWLPCLEQKRNDTMLTSECISSLLLLLLPLFVGIRTAFLGAYDEDNFGIGIRVEATRRNGGGSCGLVNCIGGSEVTLSLSCVILQAECILINK